jgi:hypothetical protein
VFEPLADRAYFRRVALDHDLETIVWPHGADIAPEARYSRVTGGLKTAAV